MALEERMVLELFLVVGRQAVVLVMKLDVVVSNLLVSARYRLGTVSRSSSLDSSRLVDVVRHGTLLPGHKHARCYKDLGICNRNKPIEQGSPSSKHIEGDIPSLDSRRSL